jgi:epoxide hydrolase-like predicted phosphatase
MIKAVIFDYGGVLSAEESLRLFGSNYAPKFEKDPDEFNQLIINKWLKARVNEVSSDSFWKDLAGFLGTDKKTLRNDFMDFFGFREDVFELIKRLKSNNYKLGLLSNHIEDWLEEIIEEHKFNQTFDVIVTSYKSRIAKPDVAIYREIVDKLGVSPKDCIYIDDTKKNLPPAEEIGMKTILFTGLDELRQRLDYFSVRLK